MKTFHDRRFIFSLALNSLTYKRFYLLDKQHCYCKAYISRTFCYLGIGCQKKNCTSLSSGKETENRMVQIMDGVVVTPNFLEKFLCDTALLFTINQHTSQDICSQTTNYTLVFLNG